MTEQEMVSVSLTAATVFLITERKLPITSHSQATKRVDEAIEAVTNAFDMHPDEKSMRFIIIGTTALVDDGGRKFVEQRLERFVGGMKGVFPEELDIALMIINKYVRDFLTSEK